MKRFILSLFFIVLFVSACSSTPEIEPSRPPPQPTNTIEPTSPPPPTNTPEPTSTPDPVIFLDEFNGQLAPEWTWLNENPERWSITSDGWLMLQADHPGFLKEGETEQVNMLVQPAPEGDLVITTRLITEPDENFQQAGIFLIHDSANYVSVLNAFCEFCLPDTGGYGFFVEAFKESEYVANGLLIGRAPEDADAYLRLVYSSADASVTGYVAVEPDQWQPIGVVEDFPSIEQIGLGAANVPNPEGIQEDLIAHYDYLEIASQETPARTGSEPPAPPEPTEIPKPTPLPEGVLFRDDFEGYLQPGWSWINENPANWDFVELDDSIWLQIIGDKPGGLAEQTNTLMRPLPEGDFAITSHIIADPRQNHHQANIFIFENETNFIRLNFGFCDHCGLPQGGHGYFMETIIDNNPFGDFYAIPRAPEDTDVYLRLVNQGGSITAFYAKEPGDWQRIGAFGNYFDFVSVGLGATNSVPPDWEVEDIVALFDYFEISEP